MKLLLETLTSGADYLAKHGVEDARLNMEHLLAHVLKCRRLDLYLRFNESLGESDLAPLRDLVRRRATGEPLQHLLGTVEFHGHEFICDARALVPRPETEHLVSLVLERQYRGAPPQRVLDMGTGSGCIGLSLAWAWPEASLTLADVSEEALELARLNAGRLGLSGQRVRLVRSDLFEKIVGEFDLIIANLPYIPREELRELSREVNRDPVTALNGGHLGLEVIDRFIGQCPPHLAPAGRIALELHLGQAQEVGRRLRQKEFREVATVPDLAGVERFIFAQRPAMLEADAATHGKPFETPAEGE